MSDKVIIDVVSNLCVTVAVVAFLYFEYKER